MGVLRVMAADLDQVPADGTRRLVIRPQQATVITFSVTVGAIFLFGAGALLVMGSPSAALLCLGIGGLFIYAMVSGYLWVDGDRVGVNRLAWGASCRRDQLDRLQIVFVGRSRRVCAFVRKDGHTAFRVAANGYGTAQLKALARYLGVPYYDLFSADSIDIQPSP